MDENKRRSQEIREPNGSGFNAAEGLAIETGCEIWQRFLREHCRVEEPGRTHFDSDTELIAAIKAEEQCLRAFASEYAAEGFFSEVASGQPDFTRGSEHYVIRYRDPKRGHRVMKTTVDAKYGRYEYSPTIYLNSLRCLYNLVPCLDIRLHGSFVTTTNYPSIVTSMAYIRGRHPRPAEIAAYLRNEGWEDYCDKSQTFDFIHRERRQIIRDAHPNNWVYETKSEVMIPIDISIEEVRS